MAEAAPKRRLAAILSADVVGYSRLMGADEAGTLSRLKAHRKEVIDPTITKHEGRIVKLMGDGILIEFPSAVGAVSCAVEVQQAMAACNERIPEAERIVFRVGINLGDIIIEGEDIYGDGVNIAARLEALADPGSVYVSEDIHRQVQGKLDWGFDDLGTHQFKNIAQPVRVYRVGLTPEASEAPKRTTARKAKPLRWVALGGIVIAVLAGVTSYWRPWEQPAAEKPKPAAPEELLKPAPTDSDRSAIAVLPFTNMSADPEQEYFVDGMTEDLITDLSKVSSLLVIARHSVFVYKGKNINIQRIGQELGVRYVLEGSVRKSDQQIRINAQLIDTRTGGHLWAERYDHQLQNIFALQDKITGQIITALAVTLTESERSRLALRYTDNLEAYDYFLRAQEQYFQFSSEGYKSARALFRKAIELDPRFARAYSALANTYANEVLDGRSNQAEGALGRALELTNTAIMLDESLPPAHWVQAFVLALSKQHDEAISKTHKALALDPNYADAYLLLAFIYVHMRDRAGDAFAPLERYAQLDPNYSSEYLGIRAQAYYWVGQYDKAAESFQRALQRQPNYLFFRLFLVSTYVRMNQLDDAGWELEEALALKPDLSLAQWGQERSFQDPEQTEQLLDDLRKAGFTQ